MHTSKDSGRNWGAAVFQPNVNKTIFTLALIIWFFFLRSSGVRKVGPCYNIGATWGTKSWQKSEFLPRWPDTLADIDSVPPPLVMMDTQQLWGQQPHDFCRVGVIVPLIKYSSYLMQFRENISDFK
jgi:hypothetical protein